MSGAIYWLIMASLIHALFWLPYTLQRILRVGLFAALGNPPLDGSFSTKLSAWAQRAQFAHINATENFAVFAALVLAAEAMGAGNAGAVVTAAMLYFFARLAHFILYTAGVPVARTLTFAVGWMATMGIALGLSGWHNEEA